MVSTNGDEEEARRFDSIKNNANDTNSDEVNVYTFNISIIFFKNIDGSIVKIIFTFVWFDILFF